MPPCCCGSAKRLLLKLTWVVTIMAAALLAVGCWMHPLAFVTMTHYCDSMLSDSTT